MADLPKRIGSALNLGALVLISSFFQRNEALQYVLIAVGDVCHHCRCRGVCPARTLA